MSRESVRRAYVEDCFDFSSIGDFAIYLKLKLGLLITTKASKGGLKISNVVGIDIYRHKLTRLGRTPRFFHLVQRRMVENVEGARFGLSSPIDCGRRGYVGCGYLHESTKEKQTKAECLKNK